MRRLAGTLLLTVSVCATAQAQFNPTAPIVVPDEEGQEGEGEGDEDKMNR